MSGAAITMIVIYGLTNGIAIAHHGKPKEGNHNWWATLIGTGISVAILWWGGFWK